LYTRRPLALNGLREEFKYSFEIPVGTEFTELLRSTAGRQRLLSYPYSHQWRSLFSKQGRKGKSCGSWNYGIRVKE
jgi:hypothetical protein